MSADSELDDLDALERIPDERWMRRNWLFMAIGVISVCWILAAYFILWISAPCASAASDVGILDGPSVVGRTLLCRPANEIGDFLAGAFSPLAFLWLFAAVVLQRSELSAQRKELSLARVVSIAQTKEARKNVKLLQAQTLVFEAQRRAEELEDADRDVQLLADLFIRELNSYGAPDKLGMTIEVDLADGTRKTIRFTTQFDGTEDLASRHSAYIINSIEEFDNLDTSVERCKFVSGGWIFKYLERYYVEAEKILPKTSIAKQLHLRQAGVLPIIYRIEQIKILYTKLGQFDASEKLPPTEKLKCDVDE